MTVASGEVSVCKHYNAVGDIALTDMLGSGRGGAYRNLDAIRALHKSGKFTKMPAKPKTVTYGYSGGAFGGEMVEVDYLKAWRNG
jgi:hypothetical protein